MIGVRCSWKVGFITEGRLFFWFEVTVRSRGRFGFYLGFILFFGFGREFKDFGWRFYV